jgi:hypothetical protein
MGEELGDTLVVFELGAVLAMHGAVHSKQLTWSVLSVGDSLEAHSPSPRHGTRSSTGRCTWWV